MNKFIEQVFTFNKLGGCSQDQSYRNYIGGIELMEEETEELKEALLDFLKNNEKLTPDIKADALDAIVDSLVVTIGTAFRMGFTRQQIELAMSLVAEQNLNKYCTTEEQAVKSVDRYSGDSRYSDVHWEKIVVDDREYYAIIGTTEQGTRKILKGAGHTDPKTMIQQICR